MPDLSDADIAGEVLTAIRGLGISAARPTCITIANYVEAEGPKSLIDGWAVSVVIAEPTEVPLIRSVG